MGGRPNAPGAARAFARVVATVERGKEDLLRAIPAARRPGVPLAEALLAYREALQEARDAMPGWRVPELVAEWEACRAGLDRAADLEERLRLEAPELSHEALLAALGDLIAPLEAFAEAARRVKAGGRGWA